MAKSAILSGNMSAVVDVLSKLKNEVTIVICPSNKDSLLVGKSIKRDVSSSRVVLAQKDKTIPAKSGGSGISVFVGTPHSLLQHQIMARPAGVGCLVVYNPAQVEAFGAAEELVQVLQKLKDSSSHGWKDKSVFVVQPGDHAAVAARAQSTIFDPLGHELPAQAPAAEQRGGADEAGLGGGAPGRAAEKEGALELSHGSYSDVVSQHLFLVLPKDSERHLMFVASMLESGSSVRAIVVADSVDESYRVFLLAKRFCLFKGIALLNKDLPETHRKHAAQEYMHGAVDVLVTTAEGITAARSVSADFGSTFLVNFSAPKTPEAYGRLVASVRGQSRTQVLSLVTREEKELLLPAVRGGLAHDFMFDESRARGIEYRVSEALRALKPRAIKKYRLAEIAALAGADKKKRGRLESQRRSRVEFKRVPAYAKKRAANSSTVGSGSMAVLGPGELKSVLLAGGIGKRKFDNRVKRKAKRAK